MRIIDSHQHLWNSDLLNYSWLDAFPTLAGSFMMAEYHEATTELDILGSVYVETDVDEPDLDADTSMIFSLAEDPANRILGIVAGVRLESPTAFAHIAPFIGHPRLKGVRRVLHTQADEIFRSIDFRSNLTLLLKYGLSFDLCVQSRQLPLALELVKSFPDIFFILDHCGSPDIRNQNLEPWKHDIEVLADQPNVACKVSGVISESGTEDWAAAKIQPFFDHIIKSFGWDRVIWGSDWPVCTLNCTLLHWEKVTQQLTESASAQQRESLFYQNARRIYRLQN